MNQTILVIHDDETYLDMMREVLLDEGYTRICCVGHREACAVITREQPGLIMFDVNRGAKDVGWQLLNDIRAGAATANTRLLLCSTDPTFRNNYAEQLHVYRCDVLEKPFALDDLFRKIYNSIGAPAH